MNRYNNPNELYHYGVLGMKWGRRRYQNKDGSLTEAGKKRVSKAYYKNIDKANKQIAKTDGTRKTNAHNRAAEDMNNGMIDKFNNDYERKLIKKYGKKKADNWDYNNDENYYNEYEKMFSKRMDKYYSGALVKDLEQNKYYKKAQNLVKEFSMEKFDDFVRDNNKIFENHKKRAKYGYEG